MSTRPQGCKGKKVVVIWKRNHSSMNHLSKVAPVLSHFCSQAPTRSSLALAVNICVLFGSELDTCHFPTTESKYNAKVNCKVSPRPARGCWGCRGERVDVRGFRGLWALTNLYPLYTPQNDPSCKLAEKVKCEAKAYQKKIHQRKTRNILVTLVVVL